MRTDYSQQSNEICCISRFTKVKGDIVSSSDIRIDGEFEGTILTKGKIVIGESAEVSGKFFCQSADAWGVISGEFMVEEHISFKSTSKMTGVLKCSKLAIEMGVVFNGTCNIITAEEYSSLLKESFPSETTP